MDIEKLNTEFAALDPRQRMERLFTLFKNVLVTSSFGTTSALLLSILSEVRPEHDVWFLDTTYHFNETLEYKEALTKRLSLRVKDLRPEEWKNKFTSSDRTWNSDPDLCCSINKVEPLAKILDQYDVWVSGLLSSQNDHRKKLRIFEVKEGMLKFYPLIDLTEDDAFRIIREKGLPDHPLKNSGYNSVGCYHCTVAGKGRSGRWVNKNKTECGLHL